MNLALASAALLVSAAPLLAQPAAPNNDDGPAVTIYSTADPAGFNPQQYIQQNRGGFVPSNVPGFGVVKEIRSLDLKEGRNTLSFTDVAQFIDPTTVSFTDLTNPQGTAVLEQRFEFDLVSPEKLLEKYIDKEVSMRVPTGDGKFDVVKGTLLSSNQGQLVIKTDAGLRMVPQFSGQVELGALPNGLITKPTLQWLVSAKQGGKHKVRTTYQTDGLTWRADYNLVLAEDEKTADLAAWVTLLNLSGTSYENAKLKLIAGDVQRIQQAQPAQYMMKAARGGIAMEQDAGFQEKAFFEYHLYSLPRRTNITQNGTQQITLFPTATGVGTEKVLVYYGLPEASHWIFPQPMQDRNLGNQSNKKVDVYIRLANTEKNSMGMPLPRGKIRVYKQDNDDGTLEFVGEDLIDHTPKNQNVLVKLGQSFDVTGERTQTNFDINVNGHVITETIRIKLSNAKKTPAKVIIKENLYRWTNWEITKQSEDFKKIDARTIHFEVDVPAEGDKSVEYTVKYTW